MRTSRLKLLVLITLVAGQLVELPSDGQAQSCKGQGVEGDLSGSADVAVIVGRTAASCSLPSNTKGILGTQPSTYYTLEIMCSTNQAAAVDGVCSATPCPTSFFALRTAHFAGGQTEPAGFECVALEEAAASPSITVAQVFAAVRRVKLPGGVIGVEPEVRGLANLESYFWVEGAEQGPVDLQVGGSTVHAEFRVVEYRWSLVGESRW